MKPMLSFRPTSRPGEDGKTREIEEEDESLLVTCFSLIGDSQQHLRHSSMKNGSFAQQKLEKGELFVCPLAVY